MEHNTDIFQECQYFSAEENMFMLCVHISFSYMFFMTFLLLTEFNLLCYGRHLYLEDLLHFMEEDKAFPS